MARRGSGSAASFLDVALGRQGRAFGRRLAIGAFVVIALLAALATTLAWRQYVDGKERALSEVRARAVLAATIFDTYFTGQTSTLRSMADSPTVVSGDVAAMRDYFARVQRRNPRLFTGGIGWIDRRGVARASSTTRRGAPVSVRDRSYFRAVMSTGRPYVSEGLISRRGQRPVLITAVPTRDARGRLTGVLAGSLLLQPPRRSKRAIDLGFEGLSVIDRKGQQLTDPELSPPRNAVLLARLRQGKEGLVSDTRGLDGQSGHVVASAPSRIPGWQTVIDRPRSAVFAAARRSLALELISIAAATLIAVALMAWIITRSRRSEAVARAQVEQWELLTRSLGEASAGQEVSDALAAALAGSFPEASVVVALQTPEPPHVEVAATAGRNLPDAELERLLGQAWRVTSSGAVAEVGGETGDRGETLVDAPSLYAAPIATGRGRVLGASVLAFADHRVLDEAERALVTAHNEHAAAALARTRRFEHEHDVAVTLQRSLLPELLPTADDMRVAARYQAGGAGLEIGGDWYDVVRRPDGIVHISVGDVAGRGIPAAALMGQLRNAFRAYAYEHDSPSEVTRRLLRHVADGDMATMACVTIDPYTRELAYCAAGHPPPLLLDIETGAVTQLEGASAPPLGFATAEQVHELRRRLSGRPAILCYTDGLVERRGASIDDGIDVLASIFARSAGAGPDAVADAAIREMVGGRESDDDVALLAVELTGVPARLEVDVPARSSVLRSVRRRHDAWMRARGIGEPERARAVLAVGEACANAVEHAYPDGTGTIRLVFEDRGGTLVMTVQDDGVWRESLSDPMRGRGIPLMRGVMDRTEIDHAGRGTKVVLEQRLPSGASVAITTSPA